MVRLAAIASLVLAAGLQIASASPAHHGIEQRDPTPKYHNDPATVSPCALWLDYDASSDPACAIILLAYGLTAQEFVQWVSCTRREVVWRPAKD